MDRKTQEKEHQESLEELEKQEEPKFGYPDPEDIDEDYVPTWEDFRPNEEDKLIREKMKKRTSFIQKVVGFSVAFAMIVSLIQIWPALFNMNSISFLQESKELSKQEEIQAYKEAVVLIQDGHSKGTGFAITEDGLIVTNRHVVNGMYPITVTFPHGERFIAELIYTDPDVDLAFIKVEGEELPALPLADTNEWAIQDEIYVIGNPQMHTQIAIDGTIIEGSDSQEDMRLDAPIFSGNSGSPVILDGKVVGVVYAKSTSDMSGVAVPIEQVLKRLPKEYK